jgi:hypothetical protein
VAVTRGKYGGKDEIVVADVVDGSPAKHAGLRLGNVLIQCKGHSMVGISFEHAVRMLVSSATVRLLVETEDTGRQHTSMLGWLPWELPANCRLLVSGDDTETINALLIRKQCVPFEMPYFTYGERRVV